MTENTTLAGLRVLDLAGPSGVYGAKLLADLGADVIKVEPPGGDALRRRGPFFGDEPHLEHSLAWFFFNTSKRGITLNLETRDGQALFRRLATRADIIVETFTPGTLDGWGLGYDTLSRENPGLILSSITPFGQDGPRAHWQANDLVAMALAGYSYVTGASDDPPTTPGGQQSSLQAGVQAAAATLIALLYRDQTGSGQRADVAVQAAAKMSLGHLHTWWDLQRTVRRRPGSLRQEPGNNFYLTRDGYIHCGLTLALARYPLMIAWMDERGMAGDLTAPRYRDVAEIERATEHFEEVVRAFFAALTRQEAMEEGQRRGVFVMPVYTAKEIIAEPHLLARDFWVQVEHPELGEGVRLTYPGPPFRNDAAPWRIARRAPRLGEHNLAVYEGELGLTRQQVAALFMAGVI